MEKEEYLQHWNYFCTLVCRLDETKNYVYHGIVDHGDGNKDLVHGKVYSDYFKQLLLLSASEFEIICKALCAEKGEEASNIVEISEIILRHFPLIVKTEIMNMYMVCIPLSDWKVIEKENRKKVEGIEWWFAYNRVKHNAKVSFNDATLENAFLALASLYVVNLYLMFSMFGNMSVSYYNPPIYFRNKYVASPVSTGDGLLPDFGNKTPFEKAKDLFPDAFDKPAMKD